MNHTHLSLVAAMAIGSLTMQMAHAQPNATGTLLSATYGADDFQGLGPCAGLIVDGVPVVFDRPVAATSISVDDFVIVTADGQRVTPLCATFLPSINADEGQTILTQGLYGSPQASPVTVEIVGNIRSTDRAVNYRGTSTAIVPWEIGAVLVYAQRLGLNQALGGFDQCANGTAQVVQLAFGSNAGNNFPNTEDYFSRFTVTLEDGSNVSPVGLADVTADNYLELCLDVSTPAVSVSIAANTITDASGQFNEVTLSGPID